MPFPLARRAILALIVCTCVLLVALDAHAANVRTAGPFVGGQQGGSVTLLDDGRILAYSGGTASLWDPEKRQWTRPSTGGQPRRYLHTTTVAGERIVFAGGLDAYGNRYGQQTALSSVTLWHPKTSTWEAGPSLLGPRFAQAAVALPGGDVLMIGGTPG